MENLQTLTDSPYDPLALTCSECGTPFRPARGTTRHPPLCRDCTRIDRQLFHEFSRIFHYSNQHALYLCVKCQQSKTKSNFDLNVDGKVCREWRTQNAQTRRADRIKQNGGAFTPEQWETLKAQYDYTCLRCGRREPEIKLCADHVKPVARGGASRISNIQPLCCKCNSWKGAREIDFRR